MCGEFPCRSFTFFLPWSGLFAFGVLVCEGEGGADIIRVEGTGQDWEDEKEYKNREEGTGQDWEDEKELKNRVEGTWYPPFFLFLL